MAVYKRTVKRFVKKAAKKVYKAAKKRYTKNNKINYGQVVKDVALVKRMLNAEKKYVTKTLTNQVFGQVLGNSSGYHSNDLTPIPTQGSGIGQRNGQSIKICSWNMTAQIIQQSAATGAVNYKLYMFQIKGDPESSPATFTAEHFNNNSFITGANIIDYNSQINPNEFGGAKLLCYKKFRIQPDTISGQTGFRTINIGGKLNHHVRYNYDTDTIAQGQIILIILADAGNCSPTVASTLGNIPQSGVNTGCVINYQLRWYYYDN